MQATCQLRLRQAEKINAADDSLLERIELFERGFDHEPVLGIEGRAGRVHGWRSVVERNDSNDTSSGTNVLDGRLRDPELSRDVRTARFVAELRDVSLAKPVNAAFEFLQPSRQSYRAFVIANEMHELSEDVDPSIRLEWDQRRRVVPPARLDESERRDLLEVGALEARS